MNQNAIDYLEEHKNNFSQEALIEQLQKAGYSESDIEEAVARVYADVSNISEQAVATSPEYAGFWIRAAAFLVDQFIVSMGTGILGLGMRSVMDASLVSGYLFIMSAVLLVWSYFVFTTYKYGATLGKQLFGLKVVGIEAQMSLSGIILRETAGRILNSFTFGIGYVMVAFTEKKQGLHDKIAGSVVVHRQ